MQPFIVAGLGNPGKEYKNTRHNAGRIVLDCIRAREGAGQWQRDKYAQALVASGIIAGSEVRLVAPDNYMNNSGKSLVPFFGDRMSPAQLIVIYDDLDLPLGGMKISFGRGAGGHKGVQSIIDTLGSKDFVRIRIGISPKTLFGTMKKPHGEGKVHRFIMGTFSTRERARLEEVAQTAQKAIEIITTEGHQKAMDEFN